MERRLIVTADRSHSFFVTELRESYHSTNGALSESQHVFINAGLNYVNCRNRAYPVSTEVMVLEMGFGTGLNTLLTWLYAEEQKMPIYYEALEKYPLTEKEVALLNYPEREKLAALHACKWEESVQLTSNFTLCKRQVDVLDYRPRQSFDLIYFDAFAPDVQPELWSSDLFAKLYAAMSKGGVLVTYSAKGLVKSALRAAGFEVQRLPGASGKWHMLRGIKN
ncbi:MAG: tRNA (5-methylaminomethyl-2-thiouridine)(34)-methyltransferase MnmD [Bacteroidales bacterium]|nr:tRNA (5-methylaminomethyl-2-thiouridine)(34)-methyltransferase MnmD [Bacteroidales bacterium]